MATFSSTRPALCVVTFLKITMYIMFLIGNL